MLFNSFEYVLFLVIVFGLFWALARSAVLRVLLLLVASYVFYMSWNATFIVLIVASTMIDYVVGARLGRTEAHRWRALLLAVSVITNVALLGLFKYADFFIDATAQSLALAGVHIAPAHLNLILPVGISFYTFQSMSYTIDIYRRQIEPTRSFIEFATYVAFFPQLVAGPIVRAKEFLPQFRRAPSLTTERLGEGLFLILCGMTKKVLIADYLAANLIDRVFDTPGSYSSTEVWIAVFGYTWQLYGDFSGYTDIARGSAKLFGFELPENFNRPFQATGPIEFWRRWHMTLSRWVQDYIFISLGGSRRGKARTYVNLFITFMIIGIWHGAGWTFVLFGLWHAIGVTSNRFLRDLLGPGRRRARGALRAALMGLNLFFFVVHWPIFRSPNVSRMIEVYQQMFAMQLWPIRIGPSVLAVIIGMTVIHYTPQRWVENLERAMIRLPAIGQAAVVAIVAAILMVVGGSQPAPFIYFQF